MALDEGKWSTLFSTRFILRLSAWSRRREGQFSYLFVVTSRSLDLHSI